MDSGSEVYLIAADPDGNPVGYAHGCSYSETGRGDTVGRYVVPSTAGHSLRAVRSSHTDSD